MLEEEKPMTDKEALKLAHGYLDRLIRGLNMDDTSEAVQVRDAIKQALAAPDLQAELDATNRQVEILSDALAESRREIDAPVQEPVFELQKTGWEIICDLDWIQTLPFGTKLYTTPPAQPAPVQDTDAHYKGVVEGVQKLFDDKRTQPAVPDAIIEAGESPDYRDGWNDCRQTMLEILKGRSQ
jgi:hypothetical protein